MSRDFKSKQVEVNKLIASGSADGRTGFMPGLELFRGDNNNDPTSGGPSILIYSQSSSTNSSGGYQNKMLDDVGKDVFVFISGSKHTDGRKRNNVALFGGDVVVDGLLGQHQSAH